MVDTAKAGATPVIIKKYANRRLYNTNVSSYITLGDLAQMTRSGLTFQVLDAKTGVDITHIVLTQIIMEAEAGDAPMLPVSFLCQLISLYHTPLQSMVPSYLAHSMDQFVANPAATARPELAGEIAGGTFEAASMIENSPLGGKKGVVRVPPPSALNAQQTVHSAINNDLAALRDQMVVMQQKLDALVN